MINHVTAWSSGGRSLDFVNMSVGYKGIIEQYSAQDLRNNFGDTIAALAQSGVTDKTIFVWAAGNGHGDPCDPADFTGNLDLCVEVIENGETKHYVDAKSPEILPGMPARISRLRRHVIAVVAVAPDSDDDGDYEIASFSNRCGIAANWCIAAPGVAVTAAYFGPDPGDSSPGSRGSWNPSGTSFAAPMVTGGLVVMKHFFRDQLTNTDLVSRLLATADSQGIYTDSSIYGQGLMDLGAATEPVGVTSVVLGDRVGGPGSTLADTRFEPDGALGNGLALALAGHEIAAFDALGAPFWFPISELAGGTPRASLTTRLRSFMSPPRERGGWTVLPPDFAPLIADRSSAGLAGLNLGIFEEPSLGMDGGHLSLAGRALTLGMAKRNGLSVAVFSTEGIGGQAPVSGATLSWQPTGARVGLRSGLVTERETMLGSTASGAFGRLASSSVFAGVEANARIDDWRLGAGAEIGTVNATPSRGMLAGLSPLTTSAFALQAERKLAEGDSLVVSVAQPLRVEVGRTRLSFPIGRTKEGQVLRGSLTADLEPTGRQIDLTAQWRRSLTTGAELRLGAGLTRQPGHDAQADPDLSLFAAWRYAF